MVRFVHLILNVRSIALCFILLASFVPNTSIADVRIEGHYPRATFQVFEHAHLPDPLDDMIFIPSWSKRLLLLPADGRVSSLFGWRLDPIAGGWRFHEGLDIANFRSSLVRAAAPGRVAYAGRASGCGLTVLIEHRGGMKTRYCHLAGLAVRRGDEVAAGEGIGSMGESGRATGSHLHFEVIRHGAQVDPAAHIGL